MVFIGYDPKELEKVKEYYDYMEKQETVWKTLIINGVKIPKYKVSNKGDVIKAKNGKLLKQSMFKGYWTVTIIFKNKERKHCFVHRLMAMTFLNIPDYYIEEGLDYDDLVINHKNGVKTHNILPNLEWCTQQENTQHAVITGLMLEAEDHPRADYTNDKIKEVCKYISWGLSYREIEEKTGVAYNVIHEIKSRRSWISISKDYVFHKKQSIPFKISDEKFLEMCKELESGKYKQNEIAKKYHVNKTYITELKQGKIRPELSKRFDFKKNEKIPKRNNKVLVEAVCKEIVAKKEKLQDIAKKYGVSPSFISELKSCNIMPEITKQYFREVTQEQS